MKKLIPAICILGVLLVLIGGLWGGIYGCIHIDQTEMRQFIDNPYPTVMALVGVVMLVLVHIHSEKERWQ